MAGAWITRSIARLLLAFRFWLAGSRRFGEGLSERFYRRRFDAKLVGQREIDLGRFEIDARDFDAHAAGQLEIAAAPFTDQRVACRIEMEVVAAELGHVHESVDVEVVQRDEDAEARHATD